MVNPLPERVRQQLNLYGGGNTLVEDVIDSIEYRHIHVIVSVYLLDALGAVVALGYHFHFYLRTFYRITFAYHGAEGAVAAEVGVTRHQQVAQVC